MTFGGERLFALGFIQTLFVVKYPLSTHVKPGVKLHTKAYLLRASRPASHSTPASRLALGPYKIFVCKFGGCALVNTILGIQHLLYCPPLLYFAINIAQYVVFPRPPCVAIQHKTIGNNNIV